MRIPSFRLIGAVLIAASLSACASLGGRGKGDIPYVARDVGTLYTAAKTRLDRGQYKDAAKLFDEVERQHPYSVWARRAQLMSAFSYYLDKDYTQSIASAQRFLSVHPGNADAPYAYYLIALGYYEQVTDVTRDQKITGQALEALGELTRRYPNTRYAADARLKVDLVRDHLAGKEMEVGRFYQARRQWLASSIRFRKVIDEFQTTTHTPEALLRLTESYLNLGVPEEAQKSAAVLGRNYPGSDYYEQAYKLMADRKVTPIPDVPLGQPIVPTSVAAAQKPGLPGEGGSAKAPKADSDTAAPVGPAATTTDAPSPAEPTPN